MKRRTKTKALEKASVFHPAPRTGGCWLCFWLGLSAALRVPGREAHEPPAAAHRPPSGPTEPAFQRELRDPGWHSNAKRLLLPASDNQWCGDRWAGPATSGHQLWKANYSTRNSCLVKWGQILIPLFPNYKHPHTTLQVKMSFVMAASLILHPETLLGKERVNVSKNGQEPRARATIYVLRPSLLRAGSRSLLWVGKSHRDLRKVVFWTLYSYLTYHLCLIKKGGIKIPAEAACTGLRWHGHRGAPRPAAASSSTHPAARVKDLSCLNTGVPATQGVPGASTVRTPGARLRSSSRSQYSWAGGKRSIIPDFNKSPIPQLQKNTSPRSFYRLL